jgi:hypothetical protein
MKVLYVILSFILFWTCNTKPKTDSFLKEVANPNDTAFLKTIKWDSLNNFVCFHIVQKGTLTNDINFNFTLKPLVIYYYINHKTEKFEKDTSFILHPPELKKLILSDSFSNRKSFDCLLKINSQIAFHLTPSLLQNVYVMTKADNNIKSLISDLKKENFVQDIVLKSEGEKKFTSIINDTTKRVFLIIKLKSDYWDLKKINDICTQLKKHPIIENAFYKDFYSGFNETETIYRITSP